MRILFMTDTRADPDSGAAGTEYCTIEALRRLGHHVDALWSDELPRHIAHGNLHYLLELPRTYRAAMQSRLARAPYDVVHASQPHGYLAARAARRHGQKPVFVHRSHGFEPHVASVTRRWAEFAPARQVARGIASDAMAALLEINYRGIAREAHGHIVSSSLCEEWLRKHYAVPAERIATIAQAAPEALRQARVAPFDAARLERMLHVAQFAFFKAPMIVARSFEAVLARRPQATLTWVCSRAHHDAARALLGPHARERVTFLDWMPQDELLRVYDSHGLFVFPSFFEGFGKALVEAMVRGLVVVATDQGGAHDLIRDGENGRRVPVGDVHALTQACIAACENPQAAAAMARAARETALAWSWERVATETAAFYQRLIDMQ